MLQCNDAAFEEKLLSQTTSNDAVLYIKGEKNFPLCGFSACSISILKQYNINMLCENILGDYSFYEWLVERNHWPVLPHVYILGEFVGGYDILKSMHETGRLADIFATHKRSGYCVA